MEDGSWKLEVGSWSSSFQAAQSSASSIKEPGTLNSQSRRLPAHLRPLPLHARFLSGFLAFLLFLSSSPAIYAMGFSAGMRSSGSGSQAGGGQGSAANLQNAGAASAALTAALAKQSLQKSQAVVNGMTTAQAQAAAAARADAAPSLANNNGLKAGWLELSATPTGASAPVASQANANNVSIDQSSPTAYIPWKHFNVGSQTTLTFNQPGSDSVAINHVTTASDPSHIFGTINANGQVYIFNQSGILFHNGSSVNVQSLVASTLPVNSQILTDLKQSAMTSQNSCLKTLDFSQWGKLNGQKQPVFGLTLGKTAGDVVVQKGATINADSGNGAVMLAAPNVRNDAAATTAAKNKYNFAGTEVSSGDSGPVMTGQAGNLFHNGPSSLYKNPSLSDDPSLPNLTASLAPAGNLLQKLDAYGNVTFQPDSWRGAVIDTPLFSREMDITQNQQSAYLYWSHFNVGAQTTVNFAQSGNTGSAGKWIAFNKVMTPSDPSHIFGKINAPGQVYMLNQGGILFHAGSTVNVQSLVAATLPINQNLAGDSRDEVAASGLMNFPKGTPQFLFTALDRDSYDPNKMGNSTPGTLGDVVVEQGASISSSVDASHSGGLVALIGPNVLNAGSINTPNGQTILAAGLQVGLTPHSSGDASLRGLDVLVGKVNDSSIQTISTKNGSITTGATGIAENTGYIGVPEGDATISGAFVNQHGVIDSSTSVSLNGRIDLLANYNIIVNPSYSSSGTSGPQFYYTKTGTVDIGAGSVMQILPEWGSSATVTGTSLALNSVVSILGSQVNMGAGSVLEAPGAVATQGASAEYGIPLGPTVTSSGNGVTIQAAQWYQSGTKNSLQYVSGGITLDPGATIDLSGSTDVQVSSAENFITLQLRAAELANSPLQQSSAIRGKNITVDDRITGTYTLDGTTYYWVGTPLGDVTGYVGLIKRNVGELTVNGGSLSLMAGGAVSIQPGSLVNVSGGWIQYSGGSFSTTKLINSFGQSVDISKATPDQVYTGIFNNLPPVYEAPYLSGGNGGLFNIQSPSVVLNGEFHGHTVTGLRQTTLSSNIGTPPVQSSLSVGFFGERWDATLSTLVNFSSGSPVVTFKKTDAVSDTSAQYLSPDLVSSDGFGNLNILNHDGSIVVPSGTYLDAGVKGSVVFEASTIDLGGSISAPGGTVSLTADLPTYDVLNSFSRLKGNNPTLPIVDVVMYQGKAYAQDGPVLSGVTSIVNSDGTTTPISALLLSHRQAGEITLGASASITVAGTVLDESPIGYQPTSSILNGGSIAITGYQVQLAGGSALNVSGGVLYIPSHTLTTYGNAGALSISAGIDSEIQTIHNGSLELDSSLAGFSGLGMKAGSLSIVAPSVLIGSSSPDPRILSLQPGFFNQGGFGSFNISGIGLTAPGTVDGVATSSTVFLPALEVAAGTLEPAVSSVILQNSGGGLVLTSFLEPQGLRPAPSLVFGAKGVGSDYTVSGSVMIRGEITMDAGSSVILDPQIKISGNVPAVQAGSFSLNAGTISMAGSVEVPGGSISISAGKSFPQNGVPSAPQITLDIAPGTLISTAAEALYVQDPSFRKSSYGALTSGGSISVSGNILAESGAILDASGGSGVYSFSPYELGQGSSKISSDLAPVFSSGGSITLAGGQVLYSDATLKAGVTPNAIGATGGSLRFFSGRFYPPSGAVATAQDINLNVSASTVIPAGFTFSGSSSLGQSMISEDRSKDGGLDGGGYVSATSFSQGGFSQLNFLGNVIFPSSLSLSATGGIAVATKGFLSVANGSIVSLSAPYVSLGTSLVPPMALSGGPINSLYSGVYFEPRGGTGELDVHASLVDVGNLSLSGVGKVVLDAPGGTIRGDGTLDLVGTLIINAAQVYPLSDTQFSVFDYNSDANGTPSSSGVNAGIIIINGAGTPSTPMSAAGSISLYASQIIQAGNLEAPFGTINLGWSGTGIQPIDPISGAGTGDPSAIVTRVPVSQSVKLSAGSLTSISAVDPSTGIALNIPFGQSPDGSTWIDPSGTGITTTGPSSKSINVSASTVATEPSAVVDLNAGGDITANQWIIGNGGTIDMIGLSLGAWIANKSYNVGDLVTYNGATWSARQANASAAPPAVSLTWTKIPNYYAIIPGYSQPFSPTGYADGGIAMGSQVTLSGGGGLPAGTYTLLPASYASQAGAYLISKMSLPTSFMPPQLQDGSVIVKGTQLNTLENVQAAPSGTSFFQLLSPNQVSARVSYKTLSANTAFSAVPGSSLPKNAGRLALNSVSTLSLRNSVLGSGASGGTGASVDISVPGNILISPDGASGSQLGTLLSASLLDSWSCGSILIGGLRQAPVMGTTSISVVAGSIEVMDNVGLNSSDIIFAANQGILLGKGVTLDSRAGTQVVPDTSLSMLGDGALVRVSSSQSTLLSRIQSDSTSIPGISISSGSGLYGASITIDSSANASIASSTMLSENAVNISAAKIAINLDGSSTAGSLNLGGDLLAHLSDTTSLDLRSYSSISLNGDGTLGSAGMKSLTLHAGEILGDNRSLKTMLQASTILLDNNGNEPTPSNASLVATGGKLSISGGLLTLGSGNMSIEGFQNIVAQMSMGVEGVSTGNITSAGNLTILTPLMTCANAVTSGIYSLGNLQVLNDGSSGIASGLGGSLKLSGSSVTLTAPVHLTSGSIVVEATGGNATISSTLDVSGETKIIYNSTEYTGGGSVQIISDKGDLALAGSNIYISAQGGASAGSLSLVAPSGAIVSLPAGLNALAPGGAAGSFTTDLKSYNAITGLSDLSALESQLTAANFFQSQNLRIRTGDVTIANARAYSYALTVDEGSVYVNGRIDSSMVPGKDAHGKTIYTGGSIALFAGNSVTLGSGAELDVHGTSFNNAGKGGSVDLEAGGSTDPTIGIIDTKPQLDGNGRFTAGSVVDLARGIIDLYVGTDTTHQLTPTLGQASGTLHLRTPQTGDASDVQMDPIGATILGASSINIEGFYRQDAKTAWTAVIDPGTSLANDFENNAYLNAQSFMANYNSVLTRVLKTTAATTGNYRNMTELNPGQEIDNSKGGLVLNNIWDLASSDWRYGPTLKPFDSSGHQIVDPNGTPIITGAWPGYLTLKAQGHITFNGALTDGFGDGNNAMYDVYAGSYQPGVDPMAVEYDPLARYANSQYGGLNYEPLLPLAKNYEGIFVNQQSWSYSITAGGDFLSANPATTSALLNGNVVLGVPYITGGQNKSSSPGASALTADAINNGTTDYYQVIRTGTGDIKISASGDLQLWNQFASIYTAGSRAVDPTMNNTFDIPSTGVNPTDQLRYGLGAVQQSTPYPAQYSYEGGNLMVNVRGGIGRWTLATGGTLGTQVADSVREMPSNWLYRSGSVDPSGTFSVINGVVTSTSWWVDFSNFFDDFGALGGGNITLLAGGTISNVNASIPTNFRMPSRDLSGNLIQSTGASGLELGGGDLIVKASRNLDAGVFYVERGNAAIDVGGSIITNPTRDPNAGNVISRRYQNSSLAYLPTTFFLGKGSISVQAGGNILMGPVANVFMTPQGINNSFWLKDYFTTYAPQDLVSISSTGGNIIMREKAFSQANSEPLPLLQLWMDGFAFPSNEDHIAAYQPWLRIAEVGIDSTVARNQQVGLGPLMSLMPSSLHLTAVSGDVTLAGNMTFMPADNGTLSIVSSGGVNGLAQIGTDTSNQNLQIWSSSTLNLSDANPADIPGINNPLAQWNAPNPFGQAPFLFMAQSTPFTASVSTILLETGSFSGFNATLQSKVSLHDSTPLHLNDNQPLQIYSQSGNISGLTLYSAKESHIIAGGDITDVGLYLQNVNPNSVSIVSALGNIIPYDPQSTLEQQIPAASSHQYRSGDIQVSGPGTLEVFAGGNIDLGNNPGSSDPTLNVGFTSIGNSRNPALPFQGANIIVSAGVKLPTGLSSSGVLALDSFAQSVLSSSDGSAYLSELSTQMAYSGDPLFSALHTAADFSGDSSLTPEQKARLEMQLFYIVLRDTGRNYSEPTSPGYRSYTTARTAIKTLLNGNEGTGNIITWSQDIASVNGGNIDLFTPGGGVIMGAINYKAAGSSVAPGIITEGGGAINIFTQQNVSIGIGRIFTLKGGDIMIWSDQGNIAAGASSKTVQSAPPTQVLVDPQSALVEADLAGIATGGGIWTLETVTGIPPSNVDLDAPAGVIDAGDAGIRSTGNLHLAATAILNADNIKVGGLSVGVPPLATSSAPAAAPVAAAPPAAAPSSAASTAAAAASSAADKTADKSTANQDDATPSVFSIDIMGYGGGEGDDDDSQKKAADTAVAPVQASL